MRVSVERSLRRLRTDYVDVLLLHEPSQLEGPDDILAMAQRLRSDGKLKAFGITSTWAGLSEHVAYRARCDLLQIEMPIDAGAWQELVRQRTGLPTVLYGAAKAFKAGSTQNLGFAGRLHAISRDLPDAVILCTMLNPDHIRENVECLT
jgi:hypothetical protein